MQPDGDLFELNVKLRCQKVKTQAVLLQAFLLPMNSLAKVFLTLHNKNLFTLSLSLSLRLCLESNDWQFERTSEITFQTLSCAPFPPLPRPSFTTPRDVRTQSPGLMLIDQKNAGWQVTKGLQQI